MICRAPVPPLDPLFDRWPAGRVIHVIQDTAFAPESFNPGVDGTGALRKPTRFAPISGGPLARNTALSAGIEAA